MDTVKQGNEGEAVSKLQNLLKALGIYQGAVDGAFGTRTKGFVIQFQKANGLEPDGIVGPRTWEVLLEKISPPKPQRSLAVYRYVGPNSANQDRATAIDDATALWCARMCVGEGGQKCSAKKAAAMLWSIMNRWMLHPGRKSWPTYLYLLRRFSQPINPRWQRGGDLAEKYAGTEYSSPARLRRRAQICALEWSDIPDTISKTVKAFQKGALPPPEELRTLDRPRISNWASHKGLSKKYPFGIAFEKSKQPDWFFEDVKLTKGSVVLDFFGA